MSNGPSSGRPWHLLPNWFRALAAQHQGAVLLETAKFDDENFKTLLFLRPVCELIAESSQDIEGVFDQIDEHIAQGHYVAGFVSYECGEAIHSTAAHDRGIASDVPLIRMGVFAEPLVFDHRTGMIDGSGVTASSESDYTSPEPVGIRESVLEISEAEYAESIRRIQEYLAAGHSYQVNFTDRVLGSFEGSSSALYQQLIEQQPVSYAAFIDCGEHQILSFSPELFYRITDCTITVKPMKGTWPRGVDLADDERAVEMLRHDSKNCAEHVTIVDLLRNDLGKVCELGSVRVDKLMEVERYSTLHQVTSTISGTLDDSKTPSEIFKALFPSGSITGAPKRRTMEIIQELERNARGVYTGAIGWFGPNGDACFNVAIRTLSTKNDQFTFGVGGGITVDSDPDEEYRECQLKASFLQRPMPEFHLIETMRASAGSIPLLDSHLQRMGNSAAYFQIPFDEQALRDGIESELEHIVNPESRVRLTLERNGQWKMFVSALDSVSWLGRILLSSHRTIATDVFLHHKTSRRQIYDSALNDAKKDGFDEVIFVNQDGFVTEGAISNIFLLIEGALVTPDTSCGVLRGIQRGHILSKLPSSESRKITFRELLTADRIWVCNALRGNRPVKSISDQTGNVLWSESYDLKNLPEPPDLLNSNFNSTAASVAD